MSRRKLRRGREEISERWEEEKDEGNKTKRKEEKRRTGLLLNEMHSMKLSVGLRNFNFVICPNSSP